MEVVSVKEMRILEERTMKLKNCTGIDLMQEAGLALTDDFLKRANPRKDSLITVFAGVGNNGGDALTVAIKLRKLGYIPNVFIVGSLSKASDTFMHYFDKVGQVKIIDSYESLDLYQERIFSSDYIIEGIFGIGLTKPIIGYREQLIEYINESDTLVYSIDVPSGINPENGLVLGEAIKANYTGVVGLYKVGNLINDAMDYHGEMKLLDINIIKETSLKSKFIEIDKYHLTLKKRLHNSHKYSYGLGVFIGGSKAMMGSIQMSAMAGLKSGLGIVKILTEENNFTQFYPELIIDYNLGNNTIPELEKAKVVVFGPGIKKNTNHQILLNYLLEKDIPLIIDGSGFLYIEPKSYKNKNIILTPHLGELAKFLRVEQKEILNAPLKYLKEITDLGFHILLKGPCNILASQDEIRFIQVNNTGLATAGSGDVLTGIISGMLANNLDILKALTDSIFIQQVSSDYAKDLYGETSIIATDILNNIYKVLKEYENV